MGTNPAKEATKVYNSYLESQNQMGSNNMIQLLEKFEEKSAAMASDLTKEVMTLYNSYLESRNQNQLRCDNLIDEFNKVRLNLLTCEEKLETKEMTINQLQLDILDRENQISKLQAELRDARSQFKEQLMENGNLRSDLTDALKRLRIVQDIVKENGLQLNSNDHRLDLIQKPIVTRSHSVRTNRETAPNEDDTTSSIDYDRTDDSYDELLNGGNSMRRSRAFTNAARERRSTSLQPRPVGTTSKRRSRGEEHVPPKKSKKPKPPPNPSHSGTRRMTTRNRSMSESSLAIAIEAEQNNLRNFVATSKTTTSTMDLRLTPRTIIKESWLGKQPISSRTHKFERMNSYLKFTNCDVCGDGVNFAAKPASRCSDCHQIVHRGCERNAPLPCIPKSGTPLRIKKDLQAYTLTDFCPSTVPMIAGPIIHLVTALENKGLDSEGIYRVPGTRAQTNKVLNDLRISRAVPKLCQQQVEILTDCIKQFLRELRDPLIPRSSREEFVRAARFSDKKLLNTAICDLPQPNKDTLAYLMIHWQKVIALSDVNKMPKENIARCVSMSVMTGQRLYGDFTNATKDSSECERVLIELLSLPSNYWMRFLTENAVDPPMSVAQSRTDLSQVNQSILGPVTTPNAKLPPTPRRLKYFDAP